MRSYIDLVQRLYEDIDHGELLFKTYSRAIKTRPNSDMIFLFKHIVDANDNVLHFEFRSVSLYGFSLIEISMSYDDGFPTIIELYGDGIKPVASTLQNFTRWLHDSFTVELNFTHIRMESGIDYVLMPIRQTSELVKWFKRYFPSEFRSHYIEIRNYINRAYP